MLCLSCPEVGIYKRKQERKKTRTRPKRAQENKNKRKQTLSRPNKRTIKNLITFLVEFLSSFFFLVFLLSCFLVSHLCLVCIFRYITPVLFIWIYCLLQFSYLLTYLSQIFTIYRVGKIVFHLTKQKFYDLSLASTWLLLVVNIWFVWFSFCSSDIIEHLVSPK